MNEHTWEAFSQRMQELGVKNLLLYKDDVCIGSLSYDEDCYRNAYSVTKSFTSTAVGMAADEGILGVWEKVTDCFPDDLPEEVSPYLEDLRVKHLLTMTIGQEKAHLMGASRPKMKEMDWVKWSLAQPFDTKPGTRFLYNNVGPYLAGVLVARRSGQTLSDYLYERLFVPMGWHYPTWEVDPVRNTFGAGGLMVTTQMLLEFGQLYLHEGEKDGKQLIPKSWIALASHAFLHDAVPEKNYYGYGYNFWICPHMAYRADGKYGQFSVIMPNKKAVLAVTADSLNDGPAKILEAFWDMIYPEL